MAGKVSAPNSPAGKVRMDDPPRWARALADRYRIEQEIGHGGMARVYLAEDLRHRRKVAVKVLREELAYAVALDRFQTEIRTAALLSHPNIVPLYDSGVIPSEGDRQPLPWFAMMRIEGETLRERIARGPLPVEDAVDITRAVAAGLDYAHALDIVHRDIKPANILLAGGVPVVADFGIARLLDQSLTDETLTAPGLALGTVQYISPEQAAADPLVDRRTDIYALGCVVYEMLAGKPPFTGPNAQAIINKHNLDPPPPLATVRPAVPPAAVAAIEKALAKAPADRWPTAGAFAHALRETTEHPVPTAPVAAWRRAWWTRRRLGRAVASAVALLAAGLAVRSVLANGGRGGSDAAPDTTRFVVFPFVHADPGLPSLREDEVLRDAMLRWDGLSVVDPFRVQDKLERGGRVVPPAGRAALRLAQDFEAGRYVQGTVARAGDSIRILATVHEGATGRELLTKALMVGAALDGLAPALRGLADTLLVRRDAPLQGNGPLPGTPHGMGTKSLPALQAFLAGSAAIESWDLVSADSAFAAAVEFDGTYRQAALWVALLRSWSGRPTTDWLWAARVAASSGELGARDSAILRALEARAGGDLPAACREWVGITRAHKQDYVAWYGSGDCQQADDVVVPDGASPSRWRFRSSYRSALDAFQRSFALHPSVHRALRSDAYASMRRLFMVSPTDGRGGHAEIAGRQVRFHGVPVWSSDSLVVAPVPIAEMARPSPLIRSLGQGQQVAIRHLREEFLEIARGWVAAYPRSPEAMEALAHGLALIGDPTAPDTLARARRLSADPALTLDLTGQEVWFRLAQGLTGELGQIRRAGAIAESLLALPDLRTRAPLLAGGLAALTGRTASLAGLASEGALDPEWDPPFALRRTGPLLWAYAAMAGHPDSTESYARKAQEAIVRNFSPADQEPLTVEWLARAAAMTYPEHILSASRSLAGSGWYLMQAIAAREAGDPARLRSALARFPRSREDRGSLELTTDLLPAEASLRWQAGDPALAQAVLDVSLGGLGRLGPSAIRDPLRAAGVVRSLILRAAMHRLHPEPEGQFAEDAARVLWSRSDRPVNQVLEQYLAVLPQ